MIVFFQFCKSQIILITLTSIFFLILSNFCSILKFDENSNRIQTFYFRIDPQMAILTQIVAILILMVQLTFCGIMNLQFNHIYTVSQNPYIFSQITIARVYQNYLYVSQANEKIQKINLITGVQQGVFAWSPAGQTVEDFVIYANGTKMVASYSTDRLVQWDTSSFANISNVSAECNSIMYLDDINRFICSIAASHRLVMRGLDLSVVINYNLGSNNGKHKVLLSSDRKSIIGIDVNIQYIIGNFSYTSSSMSFTFRFIQNITASSYSRRIYTAQNALFTFYVVSSTKITQVTAVNNTVSQYHHYQTDTIVAFKQIVNDRVAYVLQNSNSQVNFKGKNGFAAWHAFPIPEGITTLQTSVDKRKLILILQTQIQVYQFVCINNQYYDPTIFDCVPCPVACLTCFSTSPNCSSCLPGSFINNQTCSACHISCLTCENSTGCLRCAGNLNKIGIGLLCSNLSSTPPGSSGPISTPNLTSTINTTNITSTMSTAPQNKTKAIYSNIFDDLLYFITLPSALKIPFQSSFLVYISDFWIYNYHNRTYGQKVNQVFQIIQIIESHKWALAKFDKHLNLTLNPQYLGFSNYSKYSNPKFFEIENKSSTFVESLQQYFLYFAPTVILVFLLYRFIFYKTFDYRVSRHFRKNSFNFFIVFLLTEGNFEYLCYSCFNQSQMLYFFNFIDKLNANVWLLFFFLATIHAFGTFYITYWFYPKLSGKFIDEAKKMLPSFTMYTLMTNAKNFILAGIQSFLFKFYIAQMFTMLGVYFFLVGTMLYFQIKYGIFKRAIFFNFLLLQTVIKISVNFLLLIQYCVKQGDNATFDILEDCLMIALYLWGILIICGVISSFLPQTKKQKKQLLAQQIKKYEQTEQRYELSDKIDDESVEQINNSAQKTERKYEKSSKSINSLRFANRLDVVIIQYLNAEKPMQSRNQRHKQTKKSKMQFSPCSKLHNQLKMSNKNQGNVCKFRKNRIHNERKAQECIFMFETCNRSISQNDIQQLQLGPRQQVNW